MCWLVQMLKILYLFFIRASVVRLSLIPEVSEGLELLPLGRRTHLQLSVNNLSRNGRGRRWEASQLWRDPGDDRAGSWSGQHEPHLGTSISFHLSTLVFSSSLFGLYQNPLNVWMVDFAGWRASSSVRYNENEITQVFKLSVTRSGTYWITALYWTAIKVVN